MEQLNQEQKKAIFQHMSRNEDDSWTQHSAWIQATFGVYVTPDECAKFFMGAMMGFMD